MPTHISIKAVGLSTVAMLLTACVVPPSAQELSGHIGCPANEISVTGYQSPLQTGSRSANYMATCRGVQYYCSTTYDNDTSHTSCAKKQ